MSIVPASETELGIDFVDLERGAEIVDQAAKRQLGISGPEFVRRYKAGELDEFDRDEVFAVEILLPFVGESIGYREEP